MKLVRNRNALLQIANSVEGPVYVYDQSIIAQRLETLQKHLGERAKFHYAMKANPNPNILQLVLEAGFGVDAVSPSEMHLAMMMGFEDEKIFYSGNNLSPSEMHLAASSTVGFNIGELSLLQQVARDYPGREIFLRANITEGSGHHRHVVTSGRESKFGIPQNELPLAFEAANRGGLQVVGLHQHIGSGNLNISTIVDSFSALIREAKKHESRLPNLRHINFGGGFGIPYRSSERPLDFGQIAAELEELLVSQTMTHITPHFEPGRFIVAESGTLLITVNSLKTVGETTFAGTNSGMNHLIRPAVYDAYHEILNLSNPKGDLMQYDVVGNICESADYFARNRLIPEVRQGDVLAVLDIGAYGSSMCSTYNMRTLPAEVWIDESGTWSVVKPRLSSEAFARQYLAGYSA